MCRLYLLHSLLLGVQGSMKEYLEEKFEGWSEHIVESHQLCVRGVKRDWSREVI
jgi:hypothetical protein